MSATAERVLVECSVCGLAFDASPRSERDYRSGRVRPRCVLHRRGDHRPSAVIAEYRRWWLDRFSLAEIVAMGQAIEDVLRRTRAGPRRAEGGTRCRPRPFQSRAIVVRRPARFQTVTP